MSLASAREQLEAHLTAAGIRTYTGMGAFSAPCCRVMAGQPWVDLSGTASGRRTQRWEVWAVSGTMDSHSSWEEIETLVQSINDALVKLPGWSYPAWQRPSITVMGGVQYMACRGIIETRTEV